MLTSTTSHEHGLLDYLWQMVHDLYSSLLGSLHRLFSNPLSLGLLIIFLVLDPAFRLFVLTCLDQFNASLFGGTVKQLKLELAAKAEEFQQGLRMQEEQLRQILAANDAYQRQVLGDKDLQIRKLQAEVQELKIHGGRSANSAVAINFKNPEAMRKLPRQGLELDPLVLNLQRSNGVLRRKNSILVKSETNWQYKHADLVSEYDGLVAEYDDLHDEHDALIATNSALVAMLHAYEVEQHAWLAEKESLVKKLRSMSNMKDTVARNEAFKEHLQSVKENAADPWVKNAMLSMSYHQVLEQNLSMKTSLESMEAQFDSR